MYYADLGLWAVFPCHVLVDGVAISTIRRPYLQDLREGKPPADCRTLTEQVSSTNIFTREDAARERLLEHLRAQRVEAENRIHHIDNAIQRIERGG